jgi:hypothetical protein
VIEAKPNDSGILRIHFKGGWVSERTASGIVCWEPLSEARKTVLFVRFYVKTIILPRQARDKHRENSKKGPFFLQEDALAEEGEEEAASPDKTITAEAGKAPPDKTTAAAPAPAPAPAAPRTFKKGKIVLTDYTTPDLIRKSWMWVLPPPPLPHTRPSSLLPPALPCGWSFAPFTPLILCCCCCVFCWLAD